MLIWKKNITINLQQKVRGEHSQDEPNVYVHVTLAASCMGSLWPSVLPNWNMFCGPCADGSSTPIVPIFSWTSHIWCM